MGRKSSADSAWNALVLQFFALFPMQCLDIACPANLFRFFWLLQFIISNIFIRYTKMNEWLKKTHNNDIKRYRNTSTHRPSFHLCHSFFFIVFFSFNFQTETFCWCARKKNDIIDYYYVEPKKESESKKVNQIEWIGVETRSDRLPLNIHYNWHCFFLFRLPYFPSSQFKCVSFFGARFFFLSFFVFFYDNVQFWLIALTFELTKPLNTDELQ